jgi:hypothetical protein
MTRERWDGSYSHALELATQNSPESARRQGWEVGAIDHPATTQQVVLGALHRPTGRRYAFVLRRIDIARPYTDEEVRAMILHRWGQEEESPPEGIRLVAAQLAVERWRPA